MPYVEPEAGNEVVISGISGRYPSCHNIGELKEKIMDKQDLITTSTRWTAEYSEIPNRAGEMPNPEKFDASFFGIHAKQVSTMDPMSRTLMEHTFEAIVDAGLNPIELRGKKIAVVIGICYSESERVMLYDRGNQAGGFVVTGCSRAMIPNRITYWLGVHGPSYTVDTACSSSAFALEHCYRMLISGEIDGAIVGGTNICLHPYITLHFARLGVLSPDGRCKTFDENADGYVRSDAVCTVLLQRAKDAKRHYATIVHAKTNSDGYKKEGITYPSSRLQTQLLADFYEECKIPPSTVNYVEAHGTGTKVGDPEEMMAVDRVFSKDRTTPLKIGSIKSNLGHSEPVSCLCGVSKVIIAMETGILPPNINYSHPRESIKAIKEGRLEVVTEQTPWDLGYAAVNTFGFGGANAHLLLKSNPKEKVNNGAPNDDLPRLVVISGRTEDAVKSLLDAVDDVGLDTEHIRLLHDVHAYNIPNHFFRGYTVLGSKHTVGRIREIVTRGDSYSRPVWFVFSGMGSQWPEMGKMLMRFPLFAKAIEKCDAVLRPRGLDIVHIITTSDKTIFNNILNCFVGIAAVQIGLVDLLTALGIVPDNIIGHSVGELGCAYSDGCFTAEQMILAAYARGLASLETEMIHGAMAAVGLGSQNVQAICPPDIDVACHNSNTSCTLSGPSASIKEFVGKLTEKKIFAREVACGDIAYHSRYIAKAGPKLLSYLREIITEPKARSSKWLSTSVPEADWSTDAAKYSSAEYHANNLLSSVLFEETAKHIPKNAICIEIAPHGLLQAILKRSLPSEVANVPLTLRGHSDNAEFFVQALGNLFNLGMQPKLANIYPPVSFPVSRGTPMISPHIRWDHAIDYYVAYFDDAEKIASGERTVELNVSDSGLEYLTGHVIDGRNLFPAMGYLAQVWETIALMKRDKFETLSIVFENVKFHRATTIPPGGTILKLTIMIHKGTGNFEILEHDTAVVSGKVRHTMNPASDMISDTFLPPSPGDEVLNTEDIYKELKIRGYEYKNEFRSLKSSTMDGLKSHIAWHNNYVTFMDNMMQTMIFGTDKKALYVPTNIRKLVIDTKKHQELIDSMEGDEKDLPVYVHKDLDVISSGGVQIFGLIAQTIPRRKLGGIPVLEKYQFVSHRDRAQISLEEMTILSSHFALDSQPMVNVKTLEIVEDQDDIPVEDLMSPLLLSALRDLPLVQPVAHLATSEQKYANYSLPAEIRFIEADKLPVDGSVYITTGRNLLTVEQSKLKEILLALRPGGFILTQEDTMDASSISQAATGSLDIILEKCNGKKTLLLLKKRSGEPVQTEIVTMSSKNLDWLEKTKEIMKRNAETGVASRLILLTQGDKESGILGMVNCLRKEPGGEIVRAVIIQDENVPRFDLHNPFYYQQIQLDQPINILQGGQWGSYRHLPLPPPKQKLCYHAYVAQLVYGDLSSVKWLEGPIKPTDNANEQIHVVYSALNFKDVMLASGRITEDVISQRENIDGTHSTIGFEFSGTKRNGERYMGFLSTCGISNIQYTQYNLCWQIPDYVTLQEGATIPAAYATVVYAFYIVDSIKKGEKILIHSGTGSIGQAAIHLALQEGLEVFTTVGTPEKCKFIRETFPTIPDDHIGNSRDLSFEYMIMQQTHGRGVDIVLNSLSEDKLLASVRCLAHYGRFLEIGKYDIAMNNSLNMRVFLKEINFKSIMLDFAMVNLDPEIIAALKAKVQNLLHQNKIKPITSKCFGKDQIETALRYMSTGKHIGKVLLNHSEDNSPYDEPILAYPRFYCSKTASYVIFGGLGGLGLEVAEWLISRNARNLVLVSRRGITTGYQKLKLHQWRARKINIVIIKGKEGWKREDCEYILKEAAKTGPVDAVFNLAVQLKDAILTNQTIENFEESLRPKVGITKQLDQLTRTLCPELRYFVVFSSASCGRGTPGQTNYGYGNAVMERICEKRVAEGLPGLAIQWGAVGEVGLVANMQKGDKEMNIGGTLQQKVSSCMQEMERFLLQEHPVVSSMVVAEKAKVGIIAESPLQAVLNIMGSKSVELLNKEIPLSELGMDSMLAVEIKETLERDFDVFLSAAEMRTLNYRKLIMISSDKKVTSVKSEDKKVDTDENDDVFWRSSQIISTLTTLVENTTTCVDFPIANDKSKRKIFLIPGLEGSFNAFSSLMSDLKYSSTCLQFPHSDDYRSINSLAEYLLPYILAKLPNITEIILVGYSLGSLVAIEIAKKLESLGHKLNIIFIDGAPTMLKKLAVHDAKSSAESHLHNRALVSIVRKVMPSAISQFASVLEKFDTLEEKLDVLTASLKLPHVPIKYQKAVAGAICRRAYASHIYQLDETPTLNSPITLLKATKGLTPGLSASHDLELITKGAIKELNVTGDHITILENKDVTTVINDSFKI